MRKFLIAVAAVGVAEGHSQARSLRDPHTAAAVQSLDDAWGAAEVNGDVAYVDGLLLAGYQSVGANGSVTTKESIVAGIRARGGRSEKLAAQVAAWKASHPSHASVTISGDTAILTWLINRGTKTAVASSDIFVYVHGRWRAAYSQHSAMSG